MRSNQNKNFKSSIARVLALLAFFLFLSVAPKASFAEQVVPLLIGFDEANPPFMFGSNGEAKGLYPEIIGGIFSRISLPVGLYTAKWWKVLDDADKGYNGVGGLYVNKERLKKYDYSDPIFLEEIVIYTESGKEFDFETIDDLSGKTVGVIRGWSYGDEFDKARADGKFKTEEVESDIINIRKLSSGDIGLIIGTPIYIDDLIAKEGLASRIVRLPKPVAKNTAHLAFAKGESKKEILGIFNRVLADMKADGSYDRLVKEATSKQQ